MRITLVGKRNGRRVICWRACGRLTLAAMGIGALLATLAYVGLAWRWNIAAPFAGLGAGLVTALVCVLVNLCTPLARLPIIGN